MADFQRNSFIPREAPGMIPTKVRRTRTFHVFGFIATALLIGSLISAGGVYFLQRNADKNLEQSKSNLEKLRSDFKEENIAEIREFDRRLQAADLLIKNHISPLKIFAALEKKTKQKIEFSSFTLEHTPSLEVVIGLQGRTDEFRILALQELGYGEDKLLKNVVFDSVSTTDNQSTEGDAPRRVGFTLTGTFDPTSIAYDGTSLVSGTKTSFVDSNGSLSLSEETGAPEVLGASTNMDQI